MTSAGVKESGELLYMSSLIESALAHLYQLKGEQFVRDLVTSQIIRIRSSFEAAAPLGVCSTSQSAVTADLHDFGSQALDQCLARVLRKS